MCSRTIVPRVSRYYDDDGTTYGYEEEVCYRQTITASNGPSATHLNFGKPSGSYQPALKSFLIKIHGSTASRVLLEDNPLPEVSEEDLIQTEKVAWCGRRDQFGPLTILRIPSRRETAITVQLER